MDTTSTSPVPLRGLSLGHLIRAMGRHQLCTSNGSAAAGVIRVHPHDAWPKKLGIHLRGPKDG
jgi:hypothetical protein